MEEGDILKRLVLHRLVRANVWGGKHTPLEFVKKGIPQHYRDAHKGKKALEMVIKELVNNNWLLILRKRTSKGFDDHISLNPRKISDIKQFLDHNKQEERT